MKISKEDARKLADKYNINLNVVPFEEWLDGLNIELEHTCYTNKKDFVKGLVKIVLSHLEEDNRYYFFLTRIEKMRSKYSKPVIYK